MKRLSPDLLSGNYFNLENYRTGMNIWNSRRDLLEPLRGKAYGVGFMKTESHFCLILHLTEEDDIVELERVIPDEVEGIPLYWNYVKQRLPKPA